MAADKNDRLDDQLCEEIGKHIEKLTLSGQTKCDEDVLKKLKKICRISDLYVKHTYYLLMNSLEENHAEIRLSTFKIMDELFNRSHCFRDLLVSDFQTFLQLTVGTDHNQPLPKPISVAKILKSETLKAIQIWYEKYGEAYKKLVLGYNFLESCKKVNFTEIKNRCLAEKQREEERERKKKLILTQKLEITLHELEEFLPEIQSCTTEIENCLNLIIPTPDDFFLKDTEPIIDFIPQATSEIRGCENSTANICENSTSSNTPQASSEIRGCENSTANICENNTSNTPQATSGIRGSENSSSKITCENDTTNTCENSTSDISQAINDIRESDDSDNESNDSEFASELEERQFVSNYGLGTRKYNLDIEISDTGIAVEETADNKDIFLNLRDSLNVAKSKYLPRLGKWIEVFKKVDDNDDKLKQVTILHNKLEELINKSIEMKITDNNQLKEDTTCNDEDEDDEDEDFEDVPEKEGYEAEVPFHLLTASDMGLKIEPKKSRKRRSNDNEWRLTTSSNKADPTSRAANLHKLGLLEDDSKPSTSCKIKKESKQSEIPFVPFGPDIAHWENPEQIEKPSVIKYDSLHRFWIPNEHESDKASQYEVEALTNRTFEFTGKFVPVTWTCRAPLPSGALCPRMDRKKCPFHGLIIGRDKTGKPSNIEEARQLLLDQLKQDKGKRQDWKDPDLQKDIEEALGIELGSSAGKGKGKGKKKVKNKKYANLTDIKTTKITSRSRLEKKVFNKSSMKRVTSTLDTADYKRIRDKFASQFNYTHSK